MAMNGTFSVTIISRIHHCSFARVSGGIYTALGIIVTQISIIRRIFVKTIRVIGFGTISVVVICLAIFWPAAICSVHRARVGVEVSQAVRPFYLRSLCQGFVEILRVRSVNA